VQTDPSESTMARWDKVALYAIVEANCPSVMRRLDRGKTILICGQKQTSKALGSKQRLCNGRVGPEKNIVRERRDCDLDMVMSVKNEREHMR
jgi:hypothetical protein